MSLPVRLQQYSHTHTHTHTSSSSSSSSSSQTHAHKGNRNGIKNVHKKHRMRSVSNPHAHTNGVLRCTGVILLTSCKANPLAMPCVIVRCPCTVQLRQRRAHTHTYTAHTCVACNVFQILLSVEDTSRLPSKADRCTYRSRERSV